MIGAGKSKRSRANSQRMQREYTDHWEERLPRAEKPETYKKLGLPLVLMPFVLMLCGGCVATVPAASILVVALTGLLWFGDVIIPESQLYYVVYQKQPRWKVGETKEDAASRRLDTDELSASERYAGDYAGRIQSLHLVSEAPPPKHLDKLVGCAEVSLTSSMIHSCWRRDVKVVDGKIQPATLHDIYGALADTLLQEYTERQILDLRAHQETDSEIRVFDKRVGVLTKALPRTVTHTGTGLYAVKKAPTNETEVQSGAVAGQVVTIVGTVAASPAFTGGYITNTDQAETRAIVSHDTTTATLDGDITGWLDTNDLEWYDAWETIDAAVDQLFTDQGTADFTLGQTISIYDGTYTEAVTIATMEPLSQFKLWISAASGESAVTVTNTALGAAVFDCASSESITFEDFEIVSDVSGNYAISMGQEGLQVYNMVIDGNSSGGHGINTSNIYAYRTSFTDMNRAMLNSDGLWEQCTFDGNSWGLYTSEGHHGRTISDCVFLDNTDCIREYSQQPEPTIPLHSLVVVNCTFYNNTTVLTGLTPAGQRAFTFRMYNCIVHTGTLVFEYTNADSELSLVESDYNTFYNMTNIANVDGSALNLAGWQALTDERGNSPDANSVTTNPDITTPGSDWSLASTSDCIHAGIGSFSIAPKGINQVAHDKWHPNKGAWASGPGPNVSYGS